MVLENIGGAAAPPCPPFPALLLRQFENLHERCVEGNSLDAQDPFEFNFFHWLGLDRRENKEENFGNVEVRTLISKL